MSYCIVIDKRKIIGGLYLKITGKGKGKRWDSVINLNKPITKFAIGFDG